MCPPVPPAMINIERLAKTALPTCRSTALHIVDAAEPRQHRNARSSILDPDLHTGIPRLYCCFGCAEIEE